MLTIGLAVVAVTATVVMWGWLGKAAWYAVAARLGVILLVQVSILLAVAVAANRYFGFYGTWGDLVGRRQAVQIVDKYPGTSSPPDAVRPTGDISLPDAFEREGLGRGRLQHVEITGRDSGITGKGIVYLPPEYRLGPPRQSRTSQTDDPRAHAPHAGPAS